MAEAFLQHARLRLTVRSPLAVGGPLAELGPLDVVAVGGYLYHLSEERLLSELGRRGLLREFAAAVAPGGGGVAACLRPHGLLTPEFLSTCSRARTPLGVRQAPQRVRPLLRDGWQRPYIPGSSLKGAVRTALLFAQTVPDAGGAWVRGVQEVLQELREPAPGQRPPDRLSLGKPLQRRYLQGLRLPLVDARQKATVEQSDLLRCLRVSDSTPLPADAVQVQEVALLSLRGGQPYQKSTQFVEVILPGSEVEFDITLDAALLEEYRRLNGDRWLPLTSLADVPALLVRHAAAVWAEDRAYFGAGHLLHRGPARFYGGERAGIRLGWGSGLHSTTLALRLPQAVRHQLRDACFQRRSDTWFPKSRKVTIAGGLPALPLGWADVALVQT